MKKRSPPQLSLFGDPPDELPPAAAALRPLGEALPRGLFLGTSSWSFPGWREQIWGRPLSEAALAKEGLELYARHPLLRAVGIDRTYYGPVSAGVFADWAAQVPENFRFLVKAHEHCTLPRFPDHARYGSRRGLRNDRFLDPVYAAEEVVAPYVEGLGEKGFTLLFQMAPGPPPERFAERLHAFLSALPKGPLYSVELRDGRLLTPAYVEALAATDSVHCFNVHPAMAPLQRQLELVDPLAGRAFVARWMLNPRLAFDAAKARYQPFDRLIDPDPAIREQLAQLLRRAIEGSRQALLIVNNKAEGSSPASIAALVAYYLEQVRRG